MTSLLSAQETEIVLASPLFSHIQPQLLPPLLTQMKASRHSYRQGDWILNEGDPCQAFGLILSGTVQVLRDDFMGYRNIINNLEPGDLFAESYSLAAGQRLTVSAMAATADTGILFLQQDFFTDRDLMDSGGADSARVRANMTTILAAKNLFLNRNLSYLSQRSTRQKLIAYLSDQARACGSRRFEIPFNRQELADFLCVERSALSHELARMQQAGLLQTRRSYFELAEHLPESDSPI
ncbi:MAG: Crp/Fnr family transcriptional regulator [Oscillospiraceae bacterium]|nr:Crp/Fnr family transcriptional regulator [Oscillospiraceae bacterium]MDD4368773.1 Crp/Fnr family transcriptional regulator [Oscillospiraceae bacterium]